MMKLIFLVLIITCFPLSLKSQSTYIDSLTGIEISFVTDSNMFPLSWREENINGKATSLDTLEYERSKKIISLALSKYPTEVLKKNLKKIYILHDLNFYEVGYGGTNSTDAVYLTNQGIEKNYTNIYLEQTFHEEFSSILLRNYSTLIPEKTWTQCASDSIKYSSTGVEAIRNGKAAEHFETRINENGFLGQYATSNFENDINSFAKNIFCPKSNFWDVTKKYSRLNCKLEMIIDFYSKIDKNMNKDFFKKWLE